MKKHTLILLFTLLIVQFLSAQPKGKKKEEEKPPTQKEMDEMMKEMQKAMGEMSAEDKKAMDSLGIKMPDMKKMQKDASVASDAQLKKAWEDETRIVPKKDEFRIAAVPRAALTTATLNTFINDMHGKTSSLLKPASKTLGEKLYTQLKAKGLSVSAIGNNAAALWMMGRIQPAVYIMGRACVEDNTDSDNLNNYASMLSMSGAEQMAIPILNYLNTRYPRNSTILNNLGQAWFGLGEISKAEKYLDSVIRIYAYHPQANMTKSFIEESKGNNTEAINLVKKSLKHSYSQEKEERLRKMGYKLTSKDISLPNNTKPDALNLGGFTPPPFPKSVDECIALKPVWAEFRQTLESRSAQLFKQSESAMKIANDMHQKRTNESLAMVKASMAAGSPQGSIDIVPIHATESYLKQREVRDEYERKFTEFGRSSSLVITGKLAPLKAEYDKLMEKLHEEDTEQTGEGLPNKDFCPRYKEASDNFLRAYNSEKEKIFKEYLSILKPYLNDLTYWQMYSEWPEKYETHKLAAMMGWLKALSAEAPYNFESITDYKCKPANPSKGGGKLSNFDDVACKYHSEMKLGLGTFKADCSRFKTELDLGVIKLGLKQDMDKETFADQFVSCNVEIGAKAGRDVKLGPVTVEASAGARVGVEIDRTGVKDVYVIGGVKAGAGTNIISGASDALGTPSSMMGQGVSDLSLDAGVEGRISIISGRGSIYGVGIFGK